MADEDLLTRINRLAAEEHELHEAHIGEGLDAAGLTRLQQVDVELDQCWDLLRQRRALRNVGRDPSEANVRDATIVEGYQQ